ncbi:MAG: hypothetical protein F9K19_17235 [Rhizobiaceae bacterium]|nr:MAG: hypothetical protein F9K19_17235 [Rhizobiaceae bacterium]CAG0972494.1 hypothetical protein RHIZO_01296 [Rhizobiaceae bacterium]
MVRTERIYVCSGFNCHFKTRLDFGASDARRFAEIMTGGRGSPQAERSAISSAVQYYEKRAGAAIGVIDDAKSDFGASGELGQMDCIDESTNTRSLLLYLERRGLLQHHSVLANVSRGLFIDGRYPHSTAVLLDRSGKEWAVDSWYAPMGAAPDILPMAQWLKRGVMGSNAPV